MHSLRTDQTCSYHPTKSPANVHSVEIHTLQSINRYNICTSQRHHHVQYVHTISVYQNTSPVATNIDKVATFQSASNSLTYYLARSSIAYLKVGVQKRAGKFLSVPLIGIQNPYLSPNLGVHIL